MKPSTDLIIRSIIFVITLLTAIVITIFALVSANPADRYKPSALSAYTQTITIQPPSITPKVTIVPFLSRTPQFRPIDPAPTMPVIGINTTTPAGTVVPPIKMTEINLFVSTAQFGTQQSKLTEFVKGTELGLLAKLSLTNAVRFPCSCTTDTISCSDYDVRSDAQICYNSCIRRGFGDVHHLDPDKDGIACETSELPRQ